MPWFCFFCVGVVSLLEAQRKLPPDSYRQYLALALFLSFATLHDHAVEKHVKTIVKFHLYVAYIHLANAMVLAYSAKHPENIVAYIAGWALLLIQGLWLYLIGFYFCCVDVKSFRIGSYSSLLVLLVTLTITVSVALWGQPNRTGTTHKDRRNDNDVRGVSQWNPNGDVGPYTRVNLKWAACAPVMKLGGFVLTTELFVCLSLQEWF
ncbi:expressed unknown protein [Seminavis robusta]|uniref:Uncharacterized protein n=1 Tax=Seminavis robusta TaxID=568900 RepID=A0A9N8H5E0_9STRA|nr:expressed unknown protein [Seminavis robusta]|eukprot:Sro22_g015080.1 n/a (207) ;mRNA; r:7703-8323